MTTAPTSPTSPTSPTLDDEPGDPTMAVTETSAEAPSPNAIDLSDVLRTACARIAPLWPLERFVAVNPYLGLTDLRFDDAAELLASTAGASTTMTTAFYLDAMDDGRIDHADVAAALAAAGAGTAPDVATWLASVCDADDETAATAARVPTVATVATDVSGNDWVRLSTDRVSAWAAAYFDAGQALWRSADPQRPLFAAWKEEASIDRTPEVMGLRGFRATVRSLPDDPLAVADHALREIGVPGDALELYLYALLLRVGGWAAHAARIAWDRRLLGDGDDDTVVQFLAVLLAWELAVLRAGPHPVVADAWAEALAPLRSLGPRPALRAPLEHRLVLQDAFDRAAQRRLVDQLASHPTTPSTPGRSDVQAVFCIDVRSEVLRRHLEAVGDGVDTIGFAGFFGFPIEYLPLAHDGGEAQCPVLLTPGWTVAEVLADPARQEEAVAARRLAHHVRRAWKSFKMGAISCFSFVGPVGLLYLPKLFTDGHGVTRPVPRPGDEALPAWAVGATGPTLGSTSSALDTSAASATTTAEGIAPADRIELAAGALRGMSLTDGFAPLVLIVGHGSDTVNNPYATGLDCGACGGHTGEANARVAAAILNDPDVRRALVERDICIPDDVWFVAGLHNTTTDEVTIFGRELVPAPHAARLRALEADLAEAGHRARAERARRFAITCDRPGRIDAAVIGRSRDWAQVRPEWGLAGCQAFIAAPRDRTRGLDLAGRSFLHSYDWNLDDGFGVLELIMTAPMVVASWISLQYYASTVDNRLFGSGNKTLHNVVGRLGVLEGNGGDLRTGLPWQSVHDGERLQHEPLRLNVIIEAPVEAMDAVLAAHPSVRDLCDNGWVQLLAMDGTGSVSQRYVGGRRWEPIVP